MGNSAIGTDRHGPSRTTTDGDCRAGFTLIELLVVLMLISLFSAIVVPSVVSATRRESVSTQADKVAELLRFSYLSAITRRAPVKVRLDEQTGVCRVTTSSPTLPWMDEQRTASTQVLATLKVPPNVRLQVTQTQDAGGGSPFETGRAVTFYSDGRADGVVVTLTSADGEEYAVEVMGTTGEVIVREPER